MKLKALSNVHLEDGTTLPAKLFLTGIKEPVKIADISVSPVGTEYIFELKEGDLMRLRLMARDLATTYVSIVGDESQSAIIKFIDMGKKQESLTSVAEQLKKK